MFDEFDKSKIQAWLDSWSQYRADNNATSTTFPTSDIELYIFYLLILTYGALQSDEFAMNTLDESLNNLDREELEALDVYLASFHDYMLIMGIVDS